MIEESQYNTYHTSTHLGKSQKEYTKCPRCNNESINYSFMDLKFDGNVQCEVTCDSCIYTWSVIYTFSKVEIYDKQIPIKKKAQQNNSKVSRND